MERGRRQLIRIEATSHGVADVPGFECCGVSCDVRQNGDGRKDLALILSESEAVAAAVFTRHQFPAAPVEICRERLSRGQGMRGLVVNAGNANACTGNQGRRDARIMADAMAEVCGCEPDEVFVCSTGRIGRALPMENLLSGIAAAGLCLGHDAGHGDDAADAILTSDSRRKTVTVRVGEASGETRFSIGGMAKGAGMIEPDMATMLAFLVTDARVERSFLQACLAKAVERTFNAITVDGDRSTNDTVIVLANGLSRCEVKEDGEMGGAFAGAFERACEILAGMIVGDGEKTTKVVEVAVRSARNAAEAEAVARAVGNSLLVKSSWYGEDPNWGRLLDAVGYAEVALDRARFSLHYGETARDPLSWVPVYVNEEAREALLPEWRRIVRRKRFAVVISLGLGDGDFDLLASDITPGYVNFNRSE